MKAGALFRKLADLLELPGFPTLVVLLEPRASISLPKLLSPRVYGSEDMVVSLEDDITPGNFSDYVDLARCGR